MPAFNGATLVQLPMEFGNPGVEVWPPWSLLLLPGSGQQVCECVSVCVCAVLELEPTMLEPQLP